MSERNDRMARLLAADAPAARDMAFQIAVLAKIEQRRYRRGLFLNLALTAAVTLLLALVMPGLEPVLWQAMGGISVSTAALMLIAGSLALPWWMTRRV